MDPVSVISIVTGAASLAFQCAQVAKALHDMSGKFKDAHMTISSALQELEIIQLAWERIERLLRTWEDNDGADAELLLRLSRQLEFGDMIMTALGEDISGYQRGSYSFRRRSKVVWNESLFRAHQDRIRGQATAMTLLLSVLQLSSAIERKENLAKGEAILKKSDESAMSIVPSRMSSRFSFFSSDSRRQSADSSEVVYQELSIDDELFTAKVYKRNYRNNIMQYRGKARQSEETLGGNGIDYQMSKEPSAVGRCVWTVNVEYLTLASGLVETTIEGPLTSRWNLAHKISLQKNPGLVSFSQYPHVCKFVEICDLAMISRVLGSTIERFNEWKQCVLYEACKQKNQNLVKALLDHGVWKDGYRPTGNTARLLKTTPVHVAAYSASVEIVKLLIENTRLMNPLNWEDNNGYRPLHIACQEGPHAIVALLITAGANVNCLSSYTKDQPLHVATRSTANSSITLSYLLKHKANSRAQTAQGHTALHLACMNNKMNKVTVLLAENPPLLVRDEDGWIPLHVACRFGGRDLVRQLLLAGSPAQFKNRLGQDSLHVACTRGDISVVDELLGWYKFENEKYTWSESPLAAAVVGFKFQIVSRLLEGSFDPNLFYETTHTSLLQHAIDQPCSDITEYEHRLRTIEALLTFGAKTESKDDRGDTVLHLWVMADACPVEAQDQLLLELLVDNGAEVEARNIRGDTAMDLAFEGGDRRKIKALQLVGGTV